MAIKLVLLSAFFAAKLSTGSALKHQTNAKVYLFILSLGLKAPSGDIKNGLH